MSKTLYTNEMVHCRPRSLVGRALHTQNERGSGSQHRRGAGFQLSDNQFKKTGGLQEVELSLLLGFLMFHTWRINWGTYLQARVGMDPACHFLPTFLHVAFPYVFACRFPPRSWVRLLLPPLSFSQNWQVCCKEYVIRITVFRSCLSLNWVVKAITLQQVGEFLTLGALGSRVVYRSQVLRLTVRATRGILGAGYQGTLSPSHRGPQYMINKKAPGQTSLVHSRSFHLESRLCWFIRVGS